MQSDQQFRNVTVHRMKLWAVLGEMSKREYLAINLIDGSMTGDGYIAIELLPNMQGDHRLDQWPLRKAHRLLHSVCRSFARMNSILHDSFTAVYRAINHCKRPVERLQWRS